MYALVATANNRCAAVMVGAAQNASKNPRYSGWRTNRYGAGVAKPTREYWRPSRYSQTCRKPNKSKWLM